jgi:subtilisin family serine protease
MMSSLRISGKYLIIIAFSFLLSTVNLFSSNIIQPTSALDKVLENTNVDNYESDFYQGELSDGSKVSIDGFLVELGDVKADTLAKLSVDNNSENNGWKVVDDNKKNSSKEFVLIRNIDIEDVTYGDDDLDRIANLQDFKSVEPNFIYTLQYTPNDTSLASQWWLTDVSSPDADIQAFEMWDIESATQPDVTVGVIDTGANLDHADLVNNLVTGYDFDRDQVPAYDYHGHGTHVAGIIAAEANNALGGVGVSGRNNLKVMPLRIDLSVYQIILALQYAESNGVKVVNLSIGGEGYSQSLKTVIDGFDGLIIASAGNLSRSNDGSSPIYPASYDSDNLIAVAAIDTNNNVSSYSNYGAESVDVAAPGTSILSTSQNFISGSTEEFNSLADITESDYINDPLNPVDEDWGLDSNSYAIAGGGVYSNNQDHSLILATPIDASGTSETANLEISFSAVIDYSIGCVEDYLSIYVDNNDDNWVEVERYCGSFDYTSTPEAEFYTYSIDLGAATDALRVKVRWVTDESGVGTRVPTIDSLILRSYSNVLDEMASMSGTSMAAPVVSGLAGLLYSAAPDINPLYAKYLITTTGDAYLNSSSRPTATNKSVNGQEMLTRLNNPADGSFTPELSLISTNGFMSESTDPFTAQGDFNGDGIDEVASVKRISSSKMEVWVAEGHGNGTLTPTYWWESTTSWNTDKIFFMDAGDFNGDGKDDLVLTYKYSDTKFAVWVLLSNGETFSSHRWNVVDNWKVYKSLFLNTGDFNGDGKDDFVIPYYYDTNRTAYWYYLSNGSTFTKYRWYVFSSWDYRKMIYTSTGDYNGDGFDDLAVMYRYTDTSMAVWVYESKGSSVYPRRWKKNTSWKYYKTFGMASGDYDNDGDDDLSFYYKYSSTSYAVWVYRADNVYFTPQRWNVLSTISTYALSGMYSGDLIGSGVDGITAIYDYGSGNARMYNHR